MKNSCLKIDPWGTPVVIFLTCDVCAINITILFIISQMIWYEGIHQISCAKYHHSTLFYSQTRSLK